MKKDLIFENPRMNLGKKGSDSEKEKREGFPKPYLGETEEGRDLPGCSSTWRQNHSAGSVGTSQKLKFVSLVEKAELVSNFCS